jgi:hypothetical protein
MNHKYVLFIFNPPDEIDSDKPREIRIIEKVTTGVARGASCGPLNLCFFPSDKTKEEIAALLKEDNVKFVLLEEKDAEKSLPGYITQMFNQDLSVDGIRKFGNLDHPDAKPKRKLEKISLEDQLKEAVQTEDFIVAARLRDKIAEKKEPKKKDSFSYLKELFKD